MQDEQLEQGALVGIEYFRKLPGTKLERRALKVLQRAGIYPPVKQLQFSPPRRWKFDFAWPVQLIAIEIQGGTWSPKKMGHSSGSGIQADMEKHNAAALQGWLLLCYSDHGIGDGSMVDDVRRALEIRSRPST